MIIYSPTVVVYEDHFQLSVSQQRLQQLVEDVLSKHLYKSDLKDIFHFVVHLLVLSISDYQLLGAKEECTSSIALHAEANGHSMKRDCFEILESRKTDYLSKIKESLFIQELNPNPK